MHASVRKAQKRNNCNTVRLHLPADVVEALEIDDGDRIAVIVDDEGEVRLTPVTDLIDNER